MTIESRPVSGLDPRLQEPSLTHPGLTVGAGKVETARRLDQHVQAHHETESIFAPLVIDDRLKTMRLMRLGVYNKIVQNQ